MPPSLRTRTAAAGLASRFVADDAERVTVAELIRQAIPGEASAAWHGRSVLVAAERQLFTVRALLQLDGVARRIVLCPPDLAPAMLPAVIEQAQVDAIVADDAGHAAANLPHRPRPAAAMTPGTATEWLLFTSGTSGQPKLVVHTLRSLTGPLDHGPLDHGPLEHGPLEHGPLERGPPDGGAAAGPVWSTLYDVRRYGGLQILLRALLGGGSMVLSQAGEPVAAFLARAGGCGVTHVSGTPSHWRRALMSAAARRMAPRYVRLSGEVADQTILNQLAATYPHAEIAHAFASTEAGVAFDVRDGRAGFPAALIGQPGAAAELRVRGGSLHIRSERTAQRYLGTGRPLLDDDGFIDTGDMLELRGDRYHFVGRREGVINVGGQKVHPEEVEAVINRHAGVQMARVRGRANPITGALVVADIVVRQPATLDGFPALCDEILAACRQALPAYKVPAMLHAVASLDISPSGKLLRRA